MHALIVVSHPDRASLTHAVAQQLAEGVAGAGDTFEMADLASEGFDPRYTERDVAAFGGRMPLPADVVCEQARLDRADALVLIYPVYWWSMPALLKGWLDRVFTQGWAYDDRSGPRVIPMLGRLPVHLVAIGGADQATYARHGYDASMRTQIDHGIFGYCGAPVVTSDILLPSVPGFPAALLDKAQAIGRAVFTPRQDARVPHTASVPG